MDLPNQKFSERKDHFVCPDFYLLDLSCFREFEQDQIDIDAIQHSKEKPNAT